MANFKVVGLKKELAGTIGTLFGASSEKMFLEYYEDNNLEEMLLAFKEMINKMLGPAAAKRYCDGIVKRHPELGEVGVLK